MATTFGGAQREAFRDWLGINDLQAQLEAQQTQTLQLTQQQGQQQLQIERLKEDMAHTAEELVAMFNDATNAVATKLAEINDKLNAALAANDPAAITAAVQEAVGQFEAPLATLQALGADPADPVPPPVDPNAPVVNPLA